MYIWGFPKIGAYFFGGPHNKDYSILGSILGSALGWATTKFLILPTLGPEVCLNYLVALFGLPGPQKYVE